MRLFSLMASFICLLLLAGCEFRCSVGNTGPSKKEITDTTKSTALSGAVIKNELDLEVSGVKLKAAYLVNENNQPLAANETKLNRKIYLVLRFDTGWVKENQLSYLGASQRLSSQDGRVIVDAPDIFQSYDQTGISATDAKVISLSTVITQPSSSGDTYSVQFRVWDKKGTGEIKGKYKFRLIP